MNGDNRSWAILDDGRANTGGAYRFPTAVIDGGAKAYIGACMWRWPEKGPFAPGLHVESVVILHGQHYLFYRHLGDRRSGVETPYTTTAFIRSYA